MIRAGWRVGRPTKRGFWGRIAGLWRPQTTADIPVQHWYPLMQLHGRKAFGFEVDAIRHHQMFRLGEVPVRQHGATKFDELNPWASLIPGMPDEQRELSKGDVDGGFARGLLQSLEANAN